MAGIDYKPAPVTPGSIDHGALSGLADDDHAQYHNDVRGDARYYTQTLANARFSRYAGVLSKSLYTPPSSPTTGDRYIVADGASDDWLNKVGQIAEWDGSAWTFRIPTNGELVWVAAEFAHYRYSYGGWEFARFQVIGAFSGSNVASGTWCSLSIVNGKPAVAYSSSGLKYIRASYADGSAWGGAVTVDTGSVGRHAKLAVINGKPAIAYYDATNTALKYVQASDINGTAWGSPITVNNDASVGTNCWLAVINGKPAIAYYDATNTALKYVQASNADGSSWGSPVTVASVSAVGMNLLVVDGKPAIVYYTTTATAGLKYVQATNADGSSWGSPVTVATGSNVGVYLSAQIVNGKPAIAYIDLPATDAKYVQATNADGSSWGSPVTVDSSANPGTGRAIALAVINGKPAVAYWPGSTALKYAAALDTDGASWETSSAIDAVAGIDCGYVNLISANGIPQIFWYPEDTTRFLRAAII